MHYLGIDYGEKHIGIAIGESETRLSTPLKTIEYSDEKKFLQELRTLVAQEGIGTIVVGVVSGEKQFLQQHEKNVAFAELLAQEIPQAIVVTADESFTSREARKRIQEYGKKSSDDHAVAAMLILQGYFDSLS